MDDERQHDKLIHRCKKKCLLSTGKIMAGIGSHWELSFTT